MTIRSSSKSKKPPAHDGVSWSTRELRVLKAFAKSGTTAAQTAKQLGRTPAAVQQKAMRTGISFRRGRRVAAPKKK
jgi:hypothetical protein